MSDRRRFTQEEIEFVARLQAAPQAAPASGFSPTLFEGTMLVVLVSADIAMWSLVALRGLQEMLGN
ncbi:MAG: hypothetical protein WKF94_02480 [Solirubrobacteraceae bacterium]